MTPAVLSLSGWLVWLIGFSTVMLFGDPKSLDLGLVIGNMVMGIGIGLLIARGAGE